MLAASQLLAAGDIPPSERLRDPALLVVDMQNDFVRVGAPLEVPDARASIAPIQRALGAFRARRLPVVFTRFLARQTPDLMWLWSPQCWPDTRSCWKGHKRSYRDSGGILDCSEVIDEVTSWGSGGPRKVEPADPRRASQDVACQRRATLGLKVEPMAPP